MASKCSDKGKGGEKGSPGVPIRNAPTPAADAGPVKMFVHRDRSFAQRKCRCHLGQLTNAIRSCYPAADIVPHRASTTLAMAWQEVARIEYVETSKSAEIVWNDGAVAATGLDRGAVITAYLAAIATAGPGRRQQRG